jgi:hypothetical protein
VAVKYRNIIAQEMDLSPISEKQLYKMVGKLRHCPGDPAAIAFQLFPELG